MTVIEALMQAAIDRANLLRDKQVENVRDVAEASIHQVSKSAVETRVEQIGKAIHAFKELSGQADSQ